MFIEVACTRLPRRVRTGVNWIFGTAILKPCRPQAVAAMGYKFARLHARF